MAKFDVITVGGAVKDITFYADEGKIFSTPENLTVQKMLAFEYGAKIDVKEAFLGFGGGAANTAIALSHLGFKVATVFRIGNDETGRELIEKLKKEKIDINLVQIDNKLSSGFSLILVADKKEREHIAFVYRGANKFLALKNKDIFSPRFSTKWIYLTSLAGKKWLDNLKLIFDLTAKKDAKIIWNPGNLQLKAGKKMLANYLNKTQVLILNKDEAIELVLSGIKLGRRNPKFLNRPIYLLNILREWGPKIVVITNGKKGAWAYDGKKIYQQKIIRAKVLDTTGVGDSFGAAFLGGLLATDNINLALRWGMINSASVLTKVGAQNGLLTRKKLIKKL